MWTSVRSRASRSIHRPDLALSRALNLKQVWIIAFAVLAAMGTAWSLATPLGAAPDEGNHIVRSAAVVRGEFTGTSEPGIPPLFLSVTAPETYVAAIKAPLCFVFNERTPAGCEPPLTRSTRAARVSLYVARYQPFYYALVGLPTLVFADSIGFYLVRLLSLLICDALLAFAVAAVVCTARSPLFLAGLVIAVTPEVLYLSAVINPSSLEVSAAVALWTALLAWVRCLPDDPPRYLVVWAGVAGVALSLARPPSPLWTLLCFACLAPMWAGRQRLRSLVRRWDVRLASVAVVAAALVSVVWTVSERATMTMTTTLPPPGSSVFAILQGAIGQATDYVHQAIGVFGLGTRSLQVVLIVWLCSLGGLLLLGHGRADRRRQFALAFVVVAAAAVPTATVAAAAPTHGFIGFGRYFVPLYVGVPLAAGAIAPSAREDFRIAKTVTAFAGAAQVLTFYWALHRYLVGQGGPLSPTSLVAGAWRPPLPGVVLDIGFAGLVIVAVVCLGVAVKGREQPLRGCATSEQVILVKPGI